MPWLRRAARRPAAPRTARGERIYAIGDIHGRGDLLAKLIDKILTDVAGRQWAPTTILVLGDFIDRGPDSAEVLNTLFTLRHEPRFVVLPGNHELALLDSLAGRSAALNAWLGFGGMATINSLGVAPPAEGEDALAFADRLAARLGASLIDWLEALPLTWRSGDYFFCHAGVRPKVPLERQHVHDLVWIREPFLNSRRHHGAVVVHGHSEVEEVMLLPNRIAVDTGAYRTGVLSALGLQDDAVWVLSTR